MLGGGMRQAGILAAAGSYALSHNIRRLAEDHQHAQLLTGGFNTAIARYQLQAEFSCHPVQTNILFCDLSAKLAEFLRQQFTQQGILCTAGNYQSADGHHCRLRFVTHLDVSQSQIQQVIASCHQVIAQYTGKAINQDYVQARAKWGPFYEWPQIKGDGEAHPFLSPNDEFADFETWDKGNLDASQPKTNSMLAGDYARSALKNGLKLEAKLGTNPYKFGMVGSSDAHTGLAAMEEENFFGKTTPQEPSPERMFASFMDNPKTGIKIMDWEVGASGYAAVWAQENTRESIWDAMERKETYATTGSRLLVRFFGGWDFDAADAETRNPAFAGYTKGVPMGGDLSDAPAGKSPTFLVAALKDPIGANLDRIQIIKGWLDAKGETQEKVYDVVWGGDRKPDAKGKLPSVGNTVDIENASWTNTIGAPELIAVWNDPEFDAKLRAFYYVRVLEIPTPRWTAYDAKRFGTKPLEGTRMTLQERAYTSPIWYTPAK